MKEEMKIKKIRKSADLFVRSIILLTTIISLIHYSQYYQRSELLMLALLALLALIVTGITNLLEGRKAYKELRRKQ